MHEVVIVTGAGSGIGRATALTFAAGGYAVVACGRRQSKLEETRDLAQAGSAEIRPLAGDVGLPATADTLVAAANELGEFTALVNNAGVGWSYGEENPGAMAAAKDTTYAQWQEVQRINLDSVFLLCRAALPHFVARGGGSIVNIASGGGLVGMADAHSYASAKAAVINLTRSLAKTYGPNGIRCNVIAPGFVATDMVQPVLASPDNPFDDDVLKYQVSPLGRPGTPDEIAAAIFFMSVHATYCNGSVLTIDGGSLA